MQKKRNGHFIFAVLIAAMCLVFYLFTSEPYLYTDNVGVAVVLNGYYVNPLSQYQHPLFCLLISVLSRVVPSADLYTSAVHLLVFAELVTLMLLLPRRALEKQLKTWRILDYLTVCASILFCVFLSAGLNLWRANYTITAASFLFTGWLILAIKTKQEKTQLWTCIAIFYICVGYMLRKEAGLLFLPFIGLVFAAGLINEHKSGEAYRGVFKHYLPAIVALVLLIGSQAIFNAIEPYSTAGRYNEARTAMVDFPVKPWDDSFPDIHQEDYIAATNWLFSDTEVMNADLLERMAKLGSRNEYSFTREGVQSALHRMYRIAAKTDVYMSVMVILCFLTAGWNVISQNSGLRKLISLFAVLGAIVILFYYTFRGRAPLRVWQPVLFGVLYVETEMIIIGETSFKQDVTAAFMLLVSVVLYYSAGQVIAHTEFQTPHAALTSRTGADDSVYEPTFQDDDLYIWPNWHAEIPKHFGKQGKLPTQRVLEHNIALGDWTSGQPYYTEYLERIGHPNPLRDLVEKPNVYIMSNSDYILDFLRLHYGEDIELVEAGQVNGKTAYRAERLASD